MGPLEKDHVYGRLPSKHGGQNHTWLDSLDLMALSKPVVGSYSMGDSESIIDFLNQLRRHPHANEKTIC